MKILLTGANGMLGSAVTEILSKSEHELIATGRGPMRHNHLMFNSKSRYQSLEIADTLLLKEQIKLIKPNAIIHGAAITQVDECEHDKELCFNINTRSAIAMMEVAKEIGAAFYYISTDFVFDGEDGPYKETDKTSPINYYGKTKELAEEHLQKIGIPWCIIRTVLLYGRTDLIKRSNFIYWVRDNLIANKSIRVVNDQIRTPTYLPDLANAIVKAVELNARGIYHVSGENILTPYQMALEIADYLNHDKELITPVDASCFSQPGKRPQKTGFIIDKAKKDLGFEPTSFKKALSEIFENG